MVHDTSFLLDPTEETTSTPSEWNYVPSSEEPQLDSPLPLSHYLSEAKLALEGGFPNVALDSLEPCADLGSNHPEYLLLYAEAYCAMEQWEAARAWAEKGVELFPSHVPLWLLYGSICKQVGDVDEALSCIEQVIHNSDSQQTRVEALLQRASLYWELGEGEHALADYTTVLGHNPELAAVYAARGQIYHQLGRWDKALADLDQAITLDSQISAYYCHRSTTYKTLHMYVEALADLNLALAQNPRCQDALMQRGSYYVEVGDYDKALQDWSRVLRSDPFHVQALLQRGSLHHRLEHWQDAIEDFTRVIESFPYLPRPYRYRSECYESLGKIPQAISDALQALRCCEEGMGDIPRLEHRLQRLGYKGPATFPLPESPSRAELLAYLEQIPEAVCEQIKCHQEQARDFLAEGKFQDSVAYFSAAIELDPYLYDSYIGRARALAAQGKLMESLENLQQAILLCPQSDYAFHQRALIRFDMDDLDGAIEDIQCALSLFPFSVDYHNQLGLFAMLNADDELAKASFEQVHTLDPTDTSALLHLGTICLRQTQFGQAIKWYDLVLEIVPHELDALLGRGKAYSKMEMWEAARDDWEKALQFEAIEPEIYLLLSEAHLKLNQPWRALEDVHAVMELCPPEQPVWKEAARLYQEIMSFLPRATIPDVNWRFPNVERLLDAMEEEHALSLIQSLLLCFPHNALLHCLQARAHHALGNESEKQDAFEQALQYDPQHAETYFYLGCVAVEEGEYSSGVEYLLFAMEASQDAERHWDLHDAYQQLAQAYRRQKDYENAQRVLGHATTLKPKQVFTWMHWGECLLELGRVQDALYTFDQAVMLSPELALTWYQRAVCYLKQGEESLAIRDLKQALERNPKYLEKLRNDPAFRSLSISPSCILGQFIETDPNSM